MKKSIKMILYIAFIIGSTGCENYTHVIKEDFGNVQGKNVYLYTLINKKGNSVKLVSYGAAISEINVPDRNGKIENVAFGYDNIEGYLKGDLYFGKVVGQYANRIDSGTFKINQNTFHVEQNEGVKTLHGGNKGWHSQVWDSEIVKKSKYPSVCFTYNKKHLEEGFPGNMTAQVTYTWTNNNELKLDYIVSTDRETVINITNHCYFNLGGVGSGTILTQEVFFDADQYIPINSNMIPTGEIASVEGTSFDFRKAHSVGEMIDRENDEQQKIGNGYDHNLVLKHSQDISASVYDPESGRYMEIITDQPGIQFYTGNYLNGKQIGRGGVAYKFREGMCFETQHFPNSPNESSFPSTLLEPNKPFISTTIYKFSSK